MSVCKAMLRTYPESSMWYWPCDLWEIMVELKEFVHGWWDWAKTQKNFHMSEKLKRFESLAVEQRIVRKEVCRIMKDLEMIDREHHCSCSSKGAFNKWRGSKLKTGKGHIFFSPIVAGLRNQSSQEPAENEKGIHILINIRNILCWHSIVPTA